jgi:hypothetical protein
MEIGSVAWVHVALMCPHVVKVAHGHEFDVEAFSTGTVAAATGVAYHLSEALGPH